MLHPLLRVRRDGSVAWRVRACPTGATILALARNGSTVYIGGSFATVGGEKRLNAAALDMGSGRVLPWDPRVGGTPVYDRDEIVDREVNAIEIDGGRVYLGGFFDKVGGVRRVNVAVVDAATAQPMGFNLLDFGDNPFAAVEDIAVARRVVFFGGNFDTIDGEPRRAAAAVNEQTGRLLTWNPRLRGDYPTVNAVTATPRAIFVGGKFSSVWSRGRSTSLLFRP